VLAGECNGCGSLLEESTDPANRRGYEAESLVCFACEARERTADIAGQQARDSGSRDFGVKWFVRWKGGD
jgi:hypothetical protein